MTPQTSPSMNILVIDDDDRVRTLLTSILLLAGHRVIEASDGESGLGYFAKGESIDLVMTDLGMPVKNGWEVAKWVKTNTTGIPVILITGWGANLDEAKIKESQVTKSSRSLSISRRYSSTV